MSQSPRTVGFVLKASTEFLEKQRVPTPRLTSEHLMARLLNCKRLDLYLRLETVLPESYLEAMRRGVRRAANGEPTQYIVGQWEFMGRSYKVDPRALIPRPETEVLVQHVLDCEDLWAMPQSCIADVGTGTGCIVISLAAARPKGVYIGLDISEDALTLARENAASIGVTNNIAFVAADLSDAVEPESLAAVVANPPYISDADYAALPPHIREHEPKMALAAGPDGLETVRVIVQDAAIALQSGGFIFLEIGDSQADATAALLETEGFAKIEIGQDLAGRNRVAKARFQE